jgi:hypothetical protein
MENIEISDLDIAEINMKVAEQCLIKAGIEDNKESKIKALLFAKQSINNSLISLGVTDKTNIKKSKSSLVKTT